MSLGRLFRTVRYLRPSQIVARLSTRLRRVGVGHVPEIVLRRATASVVQSPGKPAEILSDDMVLLLNTEVRIGDETCWNDTAADKLTLYHLHYHDVLDAWGRAGQGRSGERFLERWIRENPPMHGNGWEPYPTSRRIVNWIKWDSRVQELDANARASLYLQARALNAQIEYHLLANHLLANAKALLLAGLYFDTLEAADWQKTGERLLREQIEEQVLGDGGHFERSPMYHAIIAEDILDIVNIGRAYAYEFPDDLSEIASRMLRWLRVMTLPGTDITRFNDSAGRIAPTYAELSEYARRLDVEVDDREIGTLTHLDDSGYAAFHGDDVVVIVDVGSVGPDYQPGHAHCECLSFEYSAGGEAIMVNTGVSTYEIGDRRHLERSTSAHNTVVYDGHEQSEIWAAFRVGRRARSRDVSVSTDSIVAAHDGYARFGVIHRRRFDFQGRTLRIEDHLKARTARRGEAYFHLAPGIDPELTNGSLRFEGLKVSFDGQLDVTVESYEFCRSFNDRVPAKRIKVSFDGRLVTIIDYANPVH